MGPILIMGIPSTKQYFPLSPHNNYYSVGVTHRLLNVSLVGLSTLSFFSLFDNSFYIWWAFLVGLCNKSTKV